MEGDYVPTLTHRVIVVDAKTQDGLVCVGMTGIVGGNRAGVYVRFDGGGTADLEGPNAVIVERVR